MSPLWLALRPVHFYFVYGKPPLASRRCYPRSQIVPNYIDTFRPIALHPRCDRQFSETRLT
ncbi:hypothetical protein [Nostoc sp.]|uniref:hypothetical protein n=1 Tax=Nostoc sp. TaxID=1180 RepID=UPI002FF53F0C